MSYLLNQLTASVTTTPTEPLDLQHLHYITQQVERFYGNGYDSLQAVLAAFAVLYAAIIAISGVFLPLWINNRSEQRIEKAITGALKKLPEIESQMRVKITDNLTASMNAKFAEEAKALEALLNSSLADEIKRVQEQVAQIQSGIFFLQGKNLAEMKHYPAAAVSFCTAVYCCIAGKDEDNMQRALNLLRRALTGITKKQFEQIERDCSNESKISNLPDALGKINENGRYNLAINQLRDAIDETMAKQDPPHPDTPKTT